MRSRLYVCGFVAILAGLMGQRMPGCGGGGGSTIPSRTLFVATSDGNCAQAEKPGDRYVVGQWAGAWIMTGPVEAGSQIVIPASMAPTLRTCCTERDAMRVMRAFEIADGLCDDANGPRACCSPTAIDSRDQPDPELPPIDPNAQAFSAAGWRAVP